MILESLLIATGNAAAAGSNASQQSGGSMMSMLIPLLVVIVVMTFISGRSQKKQREKQQKMLDAIVKGTKIRTIGGFNATVVEVGAETVMIELADKMPPVEIVKSAIALVIDEKAADADKK